jgi:alpha-beta hydrolase superfamily lysophospholipase
VAVARNGALACVPSTATAPLDIFLPWNPASVVGMYGCGALLCREVAHRYGLGWPGLLLLNPFFGLGGR